MKLTEHQLDVVSTAVGTMVINSSLVNCQAAAVKIHPGLPLAAKLILEAKTCPVNVMQKFPMIVERLL